MRRPLDPHWVTSIRDCCLVARVPFFFKQWGGRTPKTNSQQQWTNIEMRCQSPSSGGQVMS